MGFTIFHKSTQATVDVDGIGPIELDVYPATRYINLVGAIAQDGSYVNVTRKKVKRNKRDAAIAAEQIGAHLKKLDVRSFILCSDEPE